MNKKYLALFDLDGTLFDTGLVNYYAYKEALERLDIPFDKEYFVTSCNGKHYKEFLPVIMGDKATDDNIEMVHSLKKEAYKKHLDKAKINTHLFNMIRSIRDTYHIALVTTASKKNVKDIINYYNYENLFEYMVTQEDITKTKPNPQGFLIAMDYFNMSPEQTIIFEDSDVGVKAALATGASVYRITQF